MALCYLAGLLLALAPFMASLSASTPGDLAVSKVRDHYGESILAFTYADTSPVGMPGRVNDGNIRLDHPCLAEHIINGEDVLWSGLRRHLTVTASAGRST